MESETRKAIGKNIAKFRKRKGISQKLLAEKIGIGFPNISYIENGKYAPRLNTLVKMADVLDAEMYEFFIFDSHITKDNIKDALFKALDKDEALLRLIYRVYLAIKADYSPETFADDTPIKAKKTKTPKATKSTKTTVNPAKLVKVTKKASL